MSRRRKARPASAAPRLEYLCNCRSASPAKGPSRRADPDGQVRIAQNTDLYEHDDDEERPHQQGEERDRKRKIVHLGFSSRPPLVRKTGDHFSGAVKEITTGAICTMGTTELIPGSGERPEVHVSARRRGRRRDARRPR